MRVIDKHVCFFTSSPCPNKGLFKRMRQTDREKDRETETERDQETQRQPASQPNTSKQKDRQRHNQQIKRINWHSKDPATKTLITYGYHGCHLTWHANKHKVRKPDQRYILKIISETDTKTQRQNKRKSLSDRDIEREKLLGRRVRGRAGERQKTYGICPKIQNYSTLHSVTFSHPN